MQNFHNGKFLMGLSVPFFLLTLVFGTAFMFTQTTDVVTAYLASISK